MVYCYNRVILILVGMTIPAVSWPAETLGVRFSWAGTMACSTSPPAFTITNIPKGTKYLVFKLVDHDAPDFVHGGGTDSVFRVRKDSCGCVRRFV